MHDYYLRAADRATVIAALVAAGAMIQPTALDDEGNPVPSGEPHPAPGVDIDDIGVIYDTTDPENPVPVAGYHINVRSRAAIDLSAVEIIPPATPYRVWA